MSNKQRSQVLQTAATVLLALLVYAAPEKAGAEKEDRGSKNDEGTVSIPVRDFVRLHEAEERLIAIRKNPDTPSPPPRNFVVKNTTIHGVAKGSVAQVNIKFEVLFNNVMFI